MLKKLLLLFIVVPAIELILLIEIGQLIGTVPTIGLIIFTGALGAYLARQQGVQVLARLRAEMQAGQLPADPIFDGVVVLMAGALLMTPGILTDVTGFLCLIPATRRMIKAAVWSRLERMIQRGQIFTATFHGGRRVQGQPEDVVIIDHDDYS